MKKLKIINKDNYLYTLEDKDNNRYIFNLEFQEISIMPDINDFIYISKKLLDKNYEEYSNMYTFGPLDSSYGRKINNENNLNIIKLDIKDKIIYLKRLYG